MKIEEPCNLEVPTGATPMTIADAILRECDREILEEVLYYIDCFLYQHGMKNNGGEKDEEFYEEVRKDPSVLAPPFLSCEKVGEIIANGKPLPKGHGRLSDMDELVKNIVKEYGVNSIHELPQDIKMFYDKFINSAPIILDATFDYKLNNYAFFRKEEEK